MNDPCHEAANAWEEAAERAREREEEITALKEQIAQNEAVLKRVREERDAALLQLAQMKRPLIPRRL